MNIYIHPLIYLFVYNPHPSIQLSIYPSTIYSHPFTLPSIYHLCIVYPRISTSCLPPSHHSSSITIICPPTLHLLPSVHPLITNLPFYPSIDSSSIHPHNHHSSIHSLFTHSFTIYLTFIYTLSIYHPSINPSIHPSTNLPHTYLFIYHSFIPYATIYLSPVHPSTCLFIHPPFIQPSTHHHLYHSFIHSFLPTYLFTHHLSTNPLSIHHPSIHTSIHYLLIHHSSIH